MSNLSMEDRAHALENEYFHRQEQMLIEKLRKKLEEEKRAATGLSCPKCGGKLVESDYDNVEIEVCGECSGVWLDSGDLARILHHEEEKGLWFGYWFGQQ